MPQQRTGPDRTDCELMLLIRTSSSPDGWARLPRRQFGKRVHLSPNGISYRLTQLVREGIIELEFPHKAQRRGGYRLTVLEGIAYA